MKVVVDTNIIISALMSRENACRRILGMVFDGELFPLVGNALFCEYEDVISRDYLFEGCPFDTDRRNLFLDDFLSVCRWIDIRYLWRPNLRDEADNHVFELAVAGQAEKIITQNIKDFKSGEILFPDVEVIKPVDFILEKRRAEKWQH